MKTFAVFLLCLAGTLAGTVDHQQCGGPGTPIAARIDGCEGATCNVNPGTTYNCEVDFVTANPAPMLHLMVTATFEGERYTIIHADLPNSAVQPGMMYTIYFTVMPSDMLAGHEVQVMSQLSDASTGSVEICLIVIVNVSEA